MTRLAALAALALATACGEATPAAGGPCADGCLEAGRFRIAWSTGRGLAVSHADAPGRVLLESPADLPLVEAARATAEVESGGGSFVIEDRVEATCTEPELDPPEPDGDGWRLSGRFTDCDGLPVTLTLRPISERHLGLEVRLGAEGYQRTLLRWAAEPDEAFVGFGAQYDVVDARGRLLPIWCQEQGHGRGLEPLSTFLGAAEGDPSGAWHTSYTCVPWFLTSRGRALLVEDPEYLEFDLQAEDHASVRVFSSRLTARVVFGRTPLEQVEALTEHTGRMAPLPAWSQRGPILRSHGGAEEARAAVQALRAAGGEPAGLWIEDWPGTRETMFGTRMWWNWVVDEARYPDWEGLVRELREDGVRVLTYFNPYLADAPGRSRNLYAEAEAAGYLVEDAGGGVHLVDQGGFRAAVVDLSNEEARGWLSDLLVGQMELGVSGWMADFAEALPWDARLSSGEPGSSWHNRYPVEWARLNREAARRAGVEAEHLAFHRSGGTESPRWARAFWLGDQLVSWDGHDGLRTVVPALLSSGLSGYALQHSDTGGYLSLELGEGLTFVRTRELLQRWVELNAFTSLLRLHATNRPESNHQWDDDEETQAHFVRLCKVFSALSGYRERLMAEAEAHGWPVVRHPLLHHPDDPEAWRVTQQ